MSHKELEKLFKQDQSDRRNKKIREDFEKLSERDLGRRKKANGILKKGEVKTGRDFYIMSMLYQHGPNITDTKKAVKFAKKSIDLGYEDAKWMFAATTDRLLTRQGRKQKFGTQFFMDLKTKKVRIMPVNKRTTDKMRKEFNVPTLKELKDKIKEFK
jgi:hypothetical protein